MKGYFFRHLLLFCALICIQLASAKDPKNSPYKSPRLIEVTSGLPTNIFSFVKHQQYLYFDNLNGISRINTKNTPAIPETVVADAMAPLSFAFLQKQLYFTSFLEKNSLFRYQKIEDKHRFSRIISGKLIPYGLAAEGKTLYIGLEDETTKKSKIVKLIFENREEPQIKPIIPDLNYPTNITKSNNTLFFTEANKIFKVDLKDTDKRPQLLYTVANLSDKTPWPIKSIAVHNNHLYYSNNEKGTICRIDWRANNKNHEVFISNLSLPTALSVIENHLFIALNDKIVKTSLENSNP
ncbi:MAG: hypothetical protein OIF50_14170 [Flavobacteriaceae bacterium]|nr:hypothetical protein [Flavobacteriaceae bacterium]